MTLTQPQIFGAIAGAIFLLLILIIFNKKRIAYRPIPLMTGNEKEFFFRLRSALPGTFIFVQVSLAAIIAPVARVGTKKHLADFRRVSQKRADYVVYDGQMKLLAVVELDDRTHDASRDAARDAILHSAGIRTIRYQSRNKPSRDQISQDFA